MSFTPIHRCMKRFVTVGPLAYWIMLLLLVVFPLRADVVSRASTAIAKTTVYGCGYDLKILVQLCLLCDASTCGIFQLSHRGNPIGVRTDIPASGPNPRTFTVRSTRRLAYIYFSNNSLIQYNMDNWLAAPLDTGFAINTNDQCISCGTSCGTTTSCGSPSCTLAPSAPLHVTVTVDGFAHGVVSTCNNRILMTKYQVPAVGATTSGATATYYTVSISNASAGSVTAIAAYERNVYLVLQSGTCIGQSYMRVDTAGNTATELKCLASPCLVGSGSVTGVQIAFDNLHGQLIATHTGCHAVFGITSNKATWLGGIGVADYQDGFATSEAKTNDPVGPSITGRHVFFMTKDSNTANLVGRILGATSTQSYTKTFSTTYSATSDASMSWSVSTTRGSSTRSTSLSVSPSASPTTSDSPQPTVSSSPSASATPQPSLSPSFSESTDVTLSGSPSASTSMGSLSNEVTFSASVTKSNSPSPLWSGSASVSRSHTVSRTVRGSASTHSATATLSRASLSRSSSMFLTATATMSESTDATVSGSPSRGSLSPSGPSESNDPTSSPTSTSSDGTPSTTASPQRSSSTSLSESMSSDPSDTATPTTSPSVSDTVSPTASASPSVSRSPSSTHISVSPRPSLSASASMSVSERASVSTTYTVSRSTLLTTRRGGTFSISVSRANSWTVARLSPSTTASASPSHQVLSRTSLPTQTHHPGHASITETFFVEDQSSNKMLYAVVGVAAGVAGAAVLAGVAFGVFGLIAGKATAASGAAAAAATAGAVSSGVATVGSLGGGSAVVSGSGIGGGAMPPLLAGGAAAVSAKTPNAIPIAPTTLPGARGKAEPQHAFVDMGGTDEATVRQEASVGKAHTHSSTAPRRMPPTLYDHHRFHEPTFLDMDGADDDDHDTPWWASAAAPPPFAGAVAGATASLSRSPSQGRRFTYAGEVPAESRPVLDDVPDRPREVPATSVSPITLFDADVGTEEPAVPEHRENQLGTLREERVEILELSPVNGDKSPRHDGAAHVSFRLPRSTPWS